MARASDAPPLPRVYRLLFKRFGSQHWWPALSKRYRREEVCLGAILTQNTAWTNVEKAFTGLRDAGWLDLRRLASAPLQDIARAIRPAGYFNQKALRIRAFAHYAESHGGLRRLLTQEIAPLRAELLALKGIGPETADSMILYAADLPVFVVDAYTRRILARLGATAPDASYAELQDFCTSRLPRAAAIFNEFHALLVRLAKEHCTKRRPRCESCPLTRACLKRLAAA